MAAWKAALAWADKESEVSGEGGDRVTWRVSWLIVNDAGHGMEFTVLG